MTPTEIQAVLQEIGGRPNKKLGQHFLIDTSTLQAIVDAAEIRKGDRILEIGPGLGVLTDALIAKGAEVVAVEMDQRFVTYLASVIPTAVEESLLSKKGSFGYAQYDRKNVFLIQGDAAKMNWEDVVGGGEWKFVSNLPYSITSLAIRKALWAHNTPTKAVVLIQKEVADRILARDGKGSLLSLMVALSCTSVRRVKKVSRGAFYPPPKVESAVLEMTPMSWDERIQKYGLHPDEIMKVAKRGFSHPRKMLASNLGISKSILEEVGVTGNARSEDLSPDDWVELAKHIKNPHTLR